MDRTWRCSRASSWSSSELAGRSGESAARHNTSSAMRLPTPARWDWSSSRALSAMPLVRPPSAERSWPSVTDAASGPSAVSSGSTETRASLLGSWSSTRPPCHPDRSRSGSTGPRASPTNRGVDRGRVGRRRPRAPSCRSACRAWRGRCRAGAACRSGAVPQRWLPRAPRQTAPGPRCWRGGRAPRPMRSSVRSVVRPGAVKARPRPARAHERRYRAGRLTGPGRDLLCDRPGLGHGGDPPATEDPGRRQHRGEDHEPHARVEGRVQPAVERGQEAVGERRGADEDLEGQLLGDRPRAATRIATANENTIPTLEKVRRSPDACRMPCRGRRS